MMGSPDSPVNIWYWKAGQDLAQNLAAGGFGSTTQLPAGDLKLVSSYRDRGEWVVVFSRPTIQDGEYQVGLNGDSAYLSLAIWQGNGKQRDGLKHVTMGWLTVN
jgi:DMSO reductase family type II enzyme heme b subunit